MQIFFNYQKLILILTFLTITSCISKKEMMTYKVSQENKKNEIKNLNLKDSTRTELYSKKNPTTDKVKRENLDNLKNLTIDITSENKVTFEFKNERLLEGVSIQNFGKNESLNNKKEQALKATLNMFNKTPRSEMENLKFENRFS